MNYGLLITWEIWELEAFEPDTNILLQKLTSEADNPENFVVDSTGDKSSVEVSNSLRRSGVELADRRKWVLCG